MYETFVSRVKQRQLNRRERKTERSSRHFAFFARDKSGFLPAKNKESSFDALSRAKREKYV